MSKPVRETITNGLNGWDATVNNDFIKLFDRPIPIFLHTGNETNLAASFPPGSYDECLVMVNHTTLGLIPYMVNKLHSGSPTWVPLIRLADKKIRRSVSGITTLTEDDLFVVCSTPAAAYTVTLASALSMNGAELVVKNDGAQNVTLDGAGTETINGSLTYVIPGGGQNFARLKSDGSNWHIVGS